VLIQLRFKDLSLFNIFNFLQHIPD
jgi:hypothetical protein